MGRQASLARKMLMIRASLIMGVALLLGIGALSSAGISVLESHPFCFTDELLTEALRKDPALKKKMGDQERAIRNYVGRQRTEQRSQQQQGTSSNFIVPVVVYVVHRSEER